MGFLALMMSMLSAVVGVVVSRRHGRSLLAAALGYVLVLVGAAVVGGPVAYVWLGESIGRGQWAGVLAFATGVAVLLGAGVGVHFGERLFLRRITVGQLAGAAAAGAVGVLIGLFALYFGQHTWAELPVTALVIVEGPSLAVATSVWLSPESR